MASARQRLFPSFASSILLAAYGLTAAPAAAQTTDPTYCYWSPGNYYTCCNRYDVCTQFWIDAPLPPEDPPESPEK